AAEDLRVRLEAARLSVEWRIRRRSGSRCSPGDRLHPAALPNPWILREPVHRQERSREREAPRRAAPLEERLLPPRRAGASDPHRSLAAHGLTPENGPECEHRDSRAAAADDGGWRRRRNLHRRCAGPLRRRTPPWNALPRPLDELPAGRL